MEGCLPKANFQMLRKLSLYPHWGGAARGFHDWPLRRRIEAAEQLLAGTDEPLSRIAIQVGSQIRLKFILTTDQLLQE